MSEDMIKFLSMQSKYKRAIFLDRDGTIITLFDGTGYLKHVKDLRLLPGAAKAIRIFNKAGFLVFIHTNQAIIARGNLTEKKLVLIHKTLHERLRKQGARIDAMYYCPHHPRAIVKKYRIACVCRKPRPGMLRQAAKKFGVNLKRSFMIGDSSKDILAGKYAHMKTILVKTGNAGKEPGAIPIKPDLIAKNILEAARLIKKKYC